ncbi:hypothetical protein AB0C34_09725 [Nocardia sp. NPDC049220]|uniref:hypothetical protein n=1 Tax=Nocardia sp. NPDC049220 TaxID=3155273 RepID=UPI0034013E1A
MADLETTAALAPLVTDFELATTSTPLHRAAGRLRAVLPPGWRVEIVDTPNRPDSDGAPILRVVLPQG